MWRPCVDRYGAEIVDWAGIGPPEVECDAAAETFTKLVHKVGNLAGAKSSDPKMFLGLFSRNPNAPRVRKVAGMNFDNKLQKAIKKRNKLVVRVQQYTGCESASKVWKGDNKPFPLEGAGF